MPTLAAASPTAAASPAPPTRARRWLGGLVVAAIVLAAYVLVAWVGSAQDARGERILGVFTPLFIWLRDAGNEASRWLQEGRQLAGEIGIGLLVPVAIAALWYGRRRALPVLWLCGVFALAGAAQVALQGDQTSLGIGLYVAAFAGALVLGIWCPMRRIASLPPFPPGPTPRAPTLPWFWECAWVLLLTLVALLSRTWALTELYDFFDLETIDWIVQGRTWHGYLGYLDFGFVQNNGGAVQFLPTQVTLPLFGTSIFTLRLTSVLWSIIAIPLMYGLGRRAAGVTGGTIAAVLLITAPEQLFWARNENLHFAPIAICALITLHLCLWLAQRLSFAAMVVTALWMPWCRWFYSASVVAFVAPVLTALHAMLFGRGLWKKIWYVVPLLAVGLVFWVFSLTAMKAALHDGHWQFVDPSTFYGASAWRKQGEFREASLPELARLQVVSLAGGFGQVLRHMAYHTENFSHWCQRAQPAEHRTILNVGVTLMLFVGLGYLLGQINDRRAFVLAMFWGLATLPAILSVDPADRRMAMVFPATHAVVGVTLSAFLHLIRERGGRIADWLATAVAAFGLAVVALTNLSSHLQLPIQPVMYGEYPRIFKPLLERGDMILTNVQSPFRNLAVFGNLDHFLEEPACMQEVSAQGWLAAALNPRCDFTDIVYGLTLPPDRMVALRGSYHPKRISYVLIDDPASQPHIAMLRALHPTAEIDRQTVPRTDRSLVTITVDADAVAALRAPSYRAPAGAPTTTPAVLAGVALRPAADAGESGPGGTVEGGVLLERDGWYRFRLEPACAGAALTLDGEPALDDTTRPLLGGVHAFTLQLPEGGGCTLPLQILAESVTESGGARALRPEQFTNRAVAESPTLRAPHVEAFAGYAAPQMLLKLDGRPADFGVDAAGNVAVLIQERGTWRVRRFDPNGKELASWALETPLYLNIGTMAVAPDGSTAVLVQRTVTVFDPQGKPIATWEHPWFVWESQLAFWGNDLLVANIHHRDALAVFGRDGTLRGEVGTIGDAKLYAPMALSLGEQGDLLIRQLDGQVVRAHTAAGEIAPTLTTRFRAEGALQGGGFDGDGHAILPTDNGPQVFSADGRRMMAADPTRDLTQKQLGKQLRVRRANGRLYVLDGDRSVLWTIPE